MSSRRPDRNRELSGQILAIAAFWADYLNFYDLLIQKSCEKNRMSRGTHRPILITRRSDLWIRGVHMMSENYCQWRNLVACYENSARHLEKSASQLNELKNLRSRPFRHFPMSPKYGVGLENRFSSRNDRAPFRDRENSRPPCHFRQKFRSRPATVEVAHVIYDFYDVWSGFRPRKPFGLIA